MLKRKTLIALPLVVSLIVSSCKKDYSESSTLEIPSQNLSKDQYISNFTEILSKLAYKNKDVRKLLKEEAIKKFDKNYNVLYYLVKDRKIKEKTFRELLVETSSEKLISQIENNVPLLNILIPEISLFNIKAENLDVEDNEIPVAVKKENGTYLYLNGKMEVVVPKGEIPDFHVLVVRENDRVDPTSISYNKITNISASQAPNLENQIRFLSPEYDNINNNENNNISTISANTFVENNNIHPIVLQSYNYFYSDTDITKLKAYQRDFIYYGIKSKDDKGYLNQNVKDYLNYIEIDPRAYFKFSRDADKKGNPRIKESEITRRRYGFSTNELIDRMWTKGAYEFVFEIVNGDNKLPSSIKIPLLPSDLWEFNIDHKRINGTFFRRSKNTYKIDPNKFTSKLVDLKKKIPFEKWDIINNTTVRYVSIYEENIGQDVSTDETYTFETTTEGKFNFGLKLGLGETSSLDLGGDVSKTNKKTTTKNIKITYRIENDVLVNNYKIYFYDPVITSTGAKTGLYIYDTGIIKFSITPYFQ